MRQSITVLAPILLVSLLFIACSAENPRQNTAPTPPAGDGIKKDQKQAMVWFRKSAEKGYAHAMYIIGLQYANGTGITKDEKQAIHYRPPVYVIGSYKKYNLFSDFIKLYGFLK